MDPVFTPADSQLRFAVHLEELPPQQRYKPRRRITGVLPAPGAPMCLAIAQEPASTRAGHHSRCRAFGVELEPSTALVVLGQVDAATIAATSTTVVATATTTTTICAARTEAASALVPVKPAEQTCKARLQLAAVPAVPSRALVPTGPPEIYSTDASVAIVPVATTSAGAPWPGRNGSSHLRVLDYSSVGSRASGRLDALALVPRHHFPSGINGMAGGAMLSLASQSAVASGQQFAGVSSSSGNNSGSGGTSAAGSGREPCALALTRHSSKTSASDATTTSSVSVGEVSNSSASAAGARAPDSAVASRTAFIAVSASVDSTASAASADSSSGQDSSGESVGSTPTCTPNHDHYFRFLVLGFVLGIAFVRWHDYQNNPPDRSTTHALRRQRRARGSASASGARSSSSGANAAHRASNGPAAKLCRKRVQQASVSVAAAAAISKIRSDKGEKQEHPDSPVNSPRIEASLRPLSFLDGDGESLDSEVRVAIV